MLTRLLAAALLVAACSDKKKEPEAATPPATPPPAPAPVEPVKPPPAPPPEPTAPPRALTAQDCLRLLAAQLGVPADSQPYADKKVDTDQARATETLGAEVVAVRTTPPAAVCVAWKRSDAWEDEEEEYHSWTARHELAVVAPGAEPQVTDRKQVESSMSENSSSDEPSWAVIAVGPAEDALVLTRKEESGDTSLEKVAWYTIAGGKLVKQFAYKSGTDGGMPVAEVEHEVTDQVQEGRFVIRFKAKVFDEEHADDYQNQPMKTGVCTWKAASGKYACEPDVLDF